MIRTMHSRLRAAGLVLLAMAAVGCSREYEHRKIGSQDPEFEAIAGMIQALRTEGVDRTMAQASAAGLGSDQQQIVRAVLDELVQADRVELLSVDQFGDQLYRATVRIDDERNIPLLFARPERKEFYWAGKN